MNLETVGVLQTDAALSDTLTRADAAQMLSAALDVLDERQASSSWLNW
jgi:hypothetical protein